jgi:hypothetical protein
MKTAQIFKPERVYLLIRNPIVLNRSAILIVSGAFGGILLFISAIDAFGACRPRLHQGLYLGILYVGGFILTSRIFKELHDKIRGPFWLLVPASVLEKTVSRIALTTVVYIAASMLMYFVFSLISEGFNSLLFNRNHPFFNPFDRRILKGVAFYFVLQSPLLVGAIYFRKHALSKTVLAFLGYSFVFFLIFLVATRLIFGSYFGGLIPGLESIMDQLEFDHSMMWMGVQRLGRAAMSTWRIILWVIVAPLCWTICYYRLKETER